MVDENSRFVDWILVSILFVVLSVDILWLKIEVVENGVVTISSDVSGLIVVVSSSDTGSDTKYK